MFYCNVPENKLVETLLGAEKQQLLLRTKLGELLNST